MKSGDTFDVGTSETTCLVDELLNKGLVPDSVTYNTLIKGMWQAGRSQTALELFKNMCNHGQQPDRITFKILLDGLYKQGPLDEALNNIQRELFTL